MTWGFFETSVKKLPTTSGNWSTPSFYKGITIFVSSAYLKSISIPSNWILRSFRKTLNKSGPLTDPWVVALLTSFHSPTKLSLFTTLCCLSERKTKIPILNITIESKTFKLISEWDVLHNIESLTKVHIEESNPFASTIIEKTKNPVLNSE